MLQKIPARKLTCLFSLLFLTAIYLSPPAYTDDPPSNFYKEPAKSAKSESGVVSVRNPNVIVQPSDAESAITFSWLPESVRAYGEPGLKGSPVQEAIQETVIESLTESNYEYDGETPIYRRGESNIQPQDLILVKSWKWAGANFGGGGFLREITLDNRSSRSYTDLEIRIDYLGTAGPKEGIRGPTSIFVIHSLLPAKSEKTFKDINVGFRHPGERGESMRVLSLKYVTDNLSVGYILVPENALNDTDLNRGYDVTSGPSEGDDKMNEYRKGTLIIDVMDAETRTFVWRGAVQALTDSDISESEKLKRIRAAAEKLIEEFIESDQ